MSRICKLLSSWRTVFAMMAAMVLVVLSISVPVAASADDNMPSTEPTVTAEPAASSDESDSKADEIKTPQPPVKTTGPEKSDESSAPAVVTPEPKAATPSAATPEAKTPASKPTKSPSKATVVAEREDTFGAQPNGEPCSVDAILINPKGDGESHTYDAGVDGQPREKGIIVSDGDTVVQAVKTGGAGLFTVLYFEPGTNNQVGFSNPVPSEGCAVDETDTDGDGVNDEQDAFPLDKNESVDTDGDGIGNNADLDDDGDGYSDEAEVAAGTDPLDKDDHPVVTPPVDECVTLTNGNVGQYGALIWGGTSAIVTLKTRSGGYCNDWDFDVTRYAPADFPQTVQQVSAKQVGKSGLTATASVSPFTCGQSDGYAGSGPEVGSQLTGPGQDYESNHPFLSDIFGGPASYTVVNSGCDENPPPVVINPQGNITVDCHGAGQAHLDNTKSNILVGFEVVVNDVPTLYTVEGGKSMPPVTFSGAKPGSTVVLQDAEANELDSDTVPKDCGSQPPTPPTPPVTPPVTPNPPSHGGNNGVHQHGNNGGHKPASNDTVTAYSNTGLGAPASATHTNPLVWGGLSGLFGALAFGIVMLRRNKVAFTRR